MRQFCPFNHDSLPDQSPFNNFAPWSFDLTVLSVTEPVHMRMAHSRLLPDIWNTFWSTNSAQVYCHQRSLAEFLASICRLPSFCLSDCECMNFSWQRGNQKNELCGRGCLLPQLLLGTLARRNSYIELLLTDASRNYFTLLFSAPNNPRTTEKFWAQWLHGWKNCSLPNDLL